MMLNVHVNDQNIMTVDLSEKYYKLHDFQNCDQARNHAAKQYSKND